MSRRTFIASTDTLNLPGQLLVTLYEEGLTGMTIAYREHPGDSWGPPMIAKETT